MPRKRTIADEVLLDHALMVLREVGPDGLTFGAVAERAGLAASTIVQRFGAKPALREDLRDPVLTDRGRAWLAVLAGAIEARLPAVSGMLVLAQWQGTLTVWSFTREASIEDMVRRNLTELLATR
jgi:AcrR family transcriptional regulator